MNGNAFNAVQRTGHIAVALDGNLYLWGGYKESENESSQRYLPGSELIEYDPLFEKWFYRKCKGNIPPGTSGATAVKVDTNIYCYGGYREDGNTNDIFCLDMLTLSWRFVQADGPAPIPCDKTVGWTHNDKLFFFGGFGLQPDPGIWRPSDFSYVVDSHTPNMYRRGWNNQLVCFDIIDEKWSIPKYKGKAPVARAAHACAKIKSKVYIMGGRHLERRMNDLHCFDTEAMVWSGQLSTFGPTPVDRSWHSFTALTNDQLLLYGGFSQDNVPLSDCWLLHLPSLIWYQLDLPLSRPRLWHTATLLSPGEVFICGGCSQNILSHFPTHDHNVDIIVLRFTPKSLLRLCMDKIVEFDSQLQGDWNVLPNRMYMILCARIGCDTSPQARPFGGS